MPRRTIPIRPHECVAVKVGKTPYVRFDLNDYSIPHTKVQRLLTVLADPAQVRIVDGAESSPVIAAATTRARRSRIAAHVEALVDDKRAARRHRGTDRLAQAAPASQTSAHRRRRARRQSRSHHRRPAAAARSLRRRRAEAAIREALERGVPHPNAVRLALERAASSARSCPAGRRRSARPRQGAR